MIPTMLSKSRHACVAVSGGIDSLIVLQQVRQHAPDIEVLVFRADFAPHQWQIIDNLIRLWDLTVVAPPPQASYLIPNGGALARVDEYDVGGAVVPIVRDVVHTPSRCMLEDMERKFLSVSPLDYDCMFIGSRRTDHSCATGRPVQRAITRVGDLRVVAPIFYWTDEEVHAAAQDLPYSREWYEDGNDEYDTGNLLACGRCLQTGTTEPVLCPRKGRVIPGHAWDRQAMLQTFRDKFGFGGTL